MSSKQESVSDWMSLAKAYAKAEKESVQPYFFVSIEDMDTKERLYSYDLPRAMFWKYQWSYLSQLISAKAQLTINDNKLADYIKGMEDDLFFDVNTDPVVSKLKCKIASYQQKILDLETFIEKSVLLLENNNCI